MGRRLGGGGDNDKGERVGVCKEGGGEKGLKLASENIGGCSITSRNVFLKKREYSGRRQSDGRTEKREWRGK